MSSRLLSSGVSAWSKSRVKTISFCMLTTTTKTTSTKRPPRRKRVFPGSSSEEPRNARNEAGTLETAAQSTPFVPRRKDGQEFESFDAYLDSANLSPWVPSPESVARRTLQLADVTSNDIHCELGCGDGRVNFIAHDIYKPRLSLGIDNDSQLVRACRERLTKRHPLPTNLIFEESDVLSWIQMDEPMLTPTVPFRECTVLTMYFVEEALQQLKPHLERHLGDTNCRIVTTGYTMPGWEPDWIEVCLGLNLYLYKMST